MISLQEKNPREPRFAFLLFVLLNLFHKHLSNVIVALKDFSLSLKRMLASNESIGQSGVHLSQKPDSNKREIQHVAGG